MIKKKNEDEEQGTGTGAAGRREPPGELEEDILILDDDAHGLSNVELLEELTAEAARLSERRRKSSAGSEGEESPSEVEPMSGIEGDVSYLQKRIAVLEASLAEALVSESAAKERQVRALADYDNLRKRTEKEKSDHSRHALGNVVREILPVLDNLDAALSAPSLPDQVDHFRSGVELIARQLAEVLGRFGLKVVPGEGAPFDPAHHEAVAKVETDDLPHNSVAKELRKGYLLADRLLRPAMVKVAVRPEGHSAVPEDRKEEDRDVDSDSDSVPAGDGGEPAS